MLDLAFRSAANRRCCCFRSFRVSRSRVPPADSAMSSLVDDRPKSAILGTNPASKRTLSDLKSRWTIPAEWRNARPTAVECAQKSTTDGSISRS